MDFVLISIPKSNISAGFYNIRIHDILVINLGKFSKKYDNEKIIGRLKDGEVVPYYTRYDIEESGSLRGKNLELVWVNDPVDLFFMHIQGSGKITLPDGKYIQVSFVQKNGRPVRMIGRYLLDKGKLSDAEITHQSIKRYLREHPEELSHILNHNESYIFLRIVENGPVGALRTYSHYRQVYRNRSRYISQGSDCHH